MAYCIADTLQLIEFHLAGNESLSYIEEHYTFILPLNGIVVNTMVSSEYIIWARNRTNLEIDYVCLPCILSDNYPNSSSIPYQSIMTNKTADQSFQMSYGYGSAGEFIIWGVANEISFRYQFFSSSSMLIPGNYSENIVISSFNLN